MSTEQMSTPPPKPVSEVWRPELTRLPRLTAGRRILRFFSRLLFRFLFFCLTKLTVRGLENFPKKGPALIALNHLGDMDAVLGLAILPGVIEALGKIELYYLPVVGPFMDLYGIIWVHRGRPDRRAITAALEALKQGRFLAVAPEGRETLTGGLEPGTEGAAFLAHKAVVPVVPVSVTGTENARLYGNLKRMKRTVITLTVGKPFVLPEGVDRQETLQEGTRLIMEALARLLPPEYRGVYSYVENRDE